MKKGVCRKVIYILLLLSFVWFLYQRSDYRKLRLTDQIYRELVHPNWSERIYRKKWTTSSGDLISAAEEQGFDILVTTDRNLRYQQNLKERVLAIAVVLDSAWPVLKLRADEVAGAIVTLKAGDYLEI